MLLQLLCLEYKFAVNRIRQDYKYYLMCTLQYAYLRNSSSNSSIVIFAWKGSNEQTKKALSLENINDIIPLWWEAGKDHDVQVSKYQARSPSLQPLTNYKQKNLKCTLQKKKTPAATGILDNKYFVYYNNIKFRIATLSAS